MGDRDEAHDGRSETLPESSADHWEAISPNQADWPTRPAARQPSNPADRPQTFEEFYAAHYRTLLKLARYAGATKEVAEDAVTKAMCDTLKDWQRLEDPLPWAKKAVFRAFLKDKARGMDRVRERLVQRGAHPPLEGPDQNLTDWEQWQWIKKLLLDLLTPEQRRVMGLLLEGYTPKEIAALTGISYAAIRQRIRVARIPLAAAWRQQFNEPDDPLGGQG